MAKLFNRYLSVNLLGLEFGSHWQFGRVIDVPHTIKFDCEHRITQYPNEATVTIYNLSRDNQKKLTEKDVESTDIEVTAGYWPPDGAPDYGVIFKGKVRHVEVSRLPDMVTVATRIYCGDADDGYQWGNVNKTFPKGGNDPETIATEAVDQMIAKDSSIFLKLMEFELSEPEPRATTIHQSSKDVLNDISRRHDMHWQIQDGGFEMYPKKQTADPTVVGVISKDTGMVGTPKITDVGVNVTTLLMHRLRPGRLVELKSDSAMSLGVGLANGHFRIERVKFSGSNDPNESFYSILDCRRYEGETQRNRYRAAGQGG